MRSPVSPATPEGERAQSTRPSHYRSPSTASSVPSLSIDNVIGTGRQSYFQQSFDNNNKTLSRARHGSEISLNPQTGTIAGTAKDEVRRSEDFTVRARDISQGQIASTSPLDTEGRFVLENLGTANYLVELVRTSDDKVVCTEGPFDMASQIARNISIDCNKVPAAWWLLAGAAAAGITAGIVTTGASPSR